MLTLPGKQFFHDISLYIINRENVSSSHNVKVIRNRLGKVNISAKVITGLARNRYSSKYLPGKFLKLQETKLQ